MVDAVSSQTLYDGASRTAVKLVSLSDGTGESAVLKVDVSALTPAASEVRITKIRYNVWGMVATLLWDADTDVVIAHLQGDGELSAADFPGFTNNAGAGKTGDILLTTSGHTANDSYTLVLELSKR